MALCDQSVQFLCVLPISSPQEHQREMSLVRSGVSGEMSLGLPWSIRKYNYRSCFYENIILSWHIILWIGGKIYIWKPHVHQTVSATCQLRMAVCNSHFPLGTRVTCSTLCISGILGCPDETPCSRLWEEKCGYVLCSCFDFRSGVLCVCSIPNKLLVNLVWHSAVRSVFLLNHALYGSHMCVLVTHRYIFMQWYVQMHFWFCVTTLF